MRGLVVFLLSWLLPASLALAQDFAIDRAPVERYQLDNGLRVVLQRDARQPRVAGVVAYGVGSRDDPAGYRGLAHLVEHMTFRGSRHLKDGEAFGTLEALGAHVNAVTAPDHTFYYASVPAHHLPRLLWVESERMAFTLEAMDDKTFEIEREVVINEWRQRRYGVGGRIDEFIAHASLPEGHPYRHVSDYEQDLSRMRFDDVRGFYQRHYRPDNAVLVLVGNFELEAARALIERYFGPVRALPPEHPRRPAPAVRLGGEQRMVVRSRVPRPQLQVHWQVPCRNPRCAATLQLVRSLLVGDMESSLRRWLVQEGLGTGARMGTGAYAHHLHVSVHATLQRQADPLAVLAGIDRELGLVRMGRVKPEDLRNAQLGYAARALRTQDDPVFRALDLAMYADMEELDVLEAVMAMTPESLGQAVRELLPRDRRLVVEVQRAPGAPLGGAIESIDGELAPKALAIDAATRDAAAQAGAEASP